MELISRLGYPVPEERAYPGRNNRPTLSLERVVRKLDTLEKEVAAPLARRSIAGTMLKRGLLEKQRRTVNSAHVRELANVLEPMLRRGR